MPGHKEGAWRFPVLSDLCAVSVLAGVPSCHPPQPQKVVACQQGLNPAFQPDAMPQHIACTVCGHVLLLIRAAASCTTGLPGESYRVQAERRHLTTSLRLLAVLTSTEWPEVHTVQSLREPGAVSTDTFNEQVNEPLKSSLPHAPEPAAVLPDWVWLPCIQDPFITALPR